MKIIFEFDDLNPHLDVDCLDIIKHLVKHYPNIVLNFFTVPEYQGVKLKQNLGWCNEIRGLIESGNVCLGVHGHKHTQEEFQYKTYAKAVDSICEAIVIFHEANLPFVRCFRGPHWGISSDTCNALIDWQFSHLYNHKNYENIDIKFGDRLKMIYYNWNLKDDWGTFENPPGEVIVAHGHTSRHSYLSCNNSIWDVYPKIEKFMEEFNPICLRLDEV